MYCNVHVDSVFVPYFQTKYLQYDREAMSGLSRLKSRTKTVATVQAVSTVSEFIDPVFAKTGSINSGTAVIQLSLLKAFPMKLFKRMSYSNSEITFFMQGNWRRFYIFWVDITNIKLSYECKRQKKIHWILKKQPN
jgi:hypothetical protein